MKILSRYLANTVFNSILMVLFILIAIDLFILFMAEVDDIGQADYTFAAAMWVALLQLPQLLYEFAPMAGLLGTLLGLGALAARSELIVIRSAGISVLQILLAILQAVLIFLLIVTLIGELVAPKAQRLAETKKAIYLSGGQAVQTTQGTWLRNGNTFINITTMLSHHRLQGIYWYEFNNNRQLQIAGFAKSASFINHQWVLENAKTSTFTITDNNTANLQVRSNTYAQLPWHITINPTLLKLSQVNANEMNLPELYRTIHYRQENGLNNNQHSLIFWQRLLQPLASLIIILLAVPSIFGPLRTAPMGLRIVAGVAIGFSFYFINQVFGPFSLVYQLPPLWAAITPLLLFTALAVWLAQRVR